MEMLHCGHHLLHQPFGNVLRVRADLNNLVEEFASRDKLHHEIEFLRVVIINFLQTDDVGMLDLLQYFHFHA